MNAYYGYIYKTTNLINSKIYVGKKKGIVENTSDYLGSGLLISYSIKKYGKENFKKEVLCYCSDFNDQNEKEKYWIKELKSNDLTIGYNIGKGGEFGDIFTNHPDKDKIREKISKAKKGKKHPEWRNQLKSLRQTGKKHKKYSDQGRKNCSEAQKRLYKNGYVNHNKGKKVDEEHRLLNVKNLRLGALKAWDNRRKNGTVSEFGKKIWEIRRRNGTDKNVKGWETRRKNGTDWETRRKNGIKNKKKEKELCENLF